MTKAGPTPLDFDPAWWMEFAACKGEPTATFFPSRGDMDGIRRAKSICAGCPVQIDCLHYGVVFGVRYGVWGSTTEYERRQLRRQLREELGLAYNRPVREVS